MGDTGHAQATPTHKLHRHNITIFLTTDNDVVDSGGGTGDTGNGTGDDNGTNAPTTPTTPTPGPIIGTPQPDVLTGTDGDDTIIGLAGNDRLFGNGGNDTIFGGEGNDRLFGGDGDDILIGGDGVDQMTGGDGADIFVIRPGKGFARIRDFDLNEDKLGIVKGEIRLGAIEVRPFQGNNTILLLNGKIIAGLEGINPSDLRRGNVALVQSDSLS
jgi:Ca2+-binding RTX toxin-like protein